MWGQENSLCKKSSSQRIIPTRVGTSAISPDNALGCKDHPHACGDKLCRYGKEVIKMRIIPTRVGTRIPYIKTKHCVEDHPHACGDKLCSLSIYDGSMGSSPRVWGQATQHHLRFIVCGIIPTRVGTSLYSFCGYTGRQDHPHACGDKKSITIIKKKVRGSSPRVWGQEDADKLQYLSRRIIPTRVGTSPDCACTCGLCKDHPHACGDKVSIPQLSLSRIGSSPRVWGQEQT